MFHRLREWSPGPSQATIGRMIKQSPTASTRLGVGLVALALLSLGSTSAAQASSPRCAASELRVVSSGSQGAAGTQFSALRFEHRGPGHCTLSGYPGVTLLNGPDRFNTDVGRFSTGRPRTVRVDARHRAYFDLVHRAMTSDGRTCRTRVTHLRIIPPNTRRALSVRLRPKPLSLCLESVRVQAVRSTSALRPSRAASSTALRSHSASVRDCGSGGSVYRGQVRITNITSRSVPCATARRFARAFETKSGSETGYSCSEDAHCTWRGWTCRNDARRRSANDHRCVTGNRVVRWQARST